MLFSKPNTDKRLWLLGLGLGNFAGLLLLLSGNAVSRRFLETAFPYTAFGYYTADFVRVLGVCLGGLVFPALLTCLARRRYVLWGLLPIVLLVSWVVAGNFVSHGLPSLFAPASNLPVLIYLGWYVPLLIFLFWAFSCGPIFLFRWVRQKRRPRITPAASTSPARRLWLLPTLALPLLALVGLGRYNWIHPKEGHLSVKTQFASGEAHIPLVVKHGGVFVMASLNGTKTLCKIDTGSNTVQWRRNLHCAGTLTGERGQICDVQNTCMDGVTVILPHIQIGTFKVSGLPTTMQDNYTGLFSSGQEYEPDAPPLLGNPLFASTVLTIDYQHKMLTIRPQDYDLQKHPLRSEDRILQMGWTSHAGDSEKEQQLFGWPVIRAYVEGKPFWCVIDSGWEGPELGISETLLQSLPAQKHTARTSILQNFQHGSYIVSQLNHLQFQAPVLLPDHAAPVLLSSKTVVTQSLIGGNGSVGTYLMERYRITIDYPRGRILLEPYARTVPGQKQENPAPGAKQ